MRFFKQNRNWGLTLLAVYLIIASLNSLVGLHNILPLELLAVVMLAAGVLLLMGR